MRDVLAESQAAAGVFAGYQPDGGAYDEALTAEGSVRGHYALLQAALDAAGARGIKERAETCRRLVEEHGITYNAYSAGAAVEKPWQLDPVPLVIGSGDWTQLEAGLIQRATLLNKILADCYGEQGLIRSRLLPPALVFGQPDFLRPCHGIRVPDDVWLHLYACDLARSPDGRWWVVSDRTQIPTGAGYALANRLVTLRLFPEQFRQARIFRLAGFFRDVQQSLAMLARNRAENPRVVLLTPGPYNETYFEQAYLSRYLGYTLVEGQDLTVRDNRVFLKTLSGLEPVDVILRRVDDDFCDPLELRNDSMLGIPGLIEAMRAGNVAVANAPGSGLVESPAFMALLPGLCRHLLGEDLKLPSVATWWCGQKEAQAYVLDHLDELAVSAMHRRAPAAATDIERLREQVRFQPELFVGQERVTLSTAPSASQTGLVPRGVSLRAYVVAVNGTYKVMPGGLARITAGQGGVSVSMQQGGASKDTWVVSEGPVEELSLLEPKGRAVELRRVGNNLPSRMADSFFWLGRYAERADATSRLLRTALTRFNPENSGALAVLAPVLNSLREQRVLTRSSPAAATNAEALEAELLAAIFDGTRSGSLRSLAEKLQRLALLVRERTSADLWRVINQVNGALLQENSAQSCGDAIEALNQILLNVAALYGLARENMTRAQGWRFLDMGCRIERSLQVCSLVHATLDEADAENPSVLESLLEVCDSTITYRSRYNLLPHLAAVLDLVLLDDTNPRSLLFQLEQLVKHFDRLPLEQRSALPTAGERILIETLTRVRLLDPSSMTTHHAGAATAEFASVIADTLGALPRLSEAIAASYFAHSSISRAGRAT